MHGQRQRVDITVQHARTAHDGHPQKIFKKRKRISAESSYVPPDDPIGQGTELNRNDVCMYACMHVCMHVCLYVRIAQFVQRRTRDRKVASSNPSRSRGRMFYSRVNFLY